MQAAAQDDIDDVNDIEAQLYDELDDLGQEEPINELRLSQIHVPIGNEGSIKTDPDIIDSTHYFTFDLVEC